MDGSPIRQRWWLPSNSPADGVQTSLQINSYSSNLDCTALSAPEQHWKEPRSHEYLRKNCDTDLCRFLLTLRRTESLWHPVLSPHNLIINWQYTVIAESLSQGTKQEAHKRDEVGALQQQRPATIKTLLIKITRGTNQQLKLIVFIVPRIEKLTRRANELKTFRQTQRERDCFHNR